MDNAIAIMRDHGVHVDESGSSTMTRARRVSRHDRARLRPDDWPELFPRSSTRTSSSSARRSGWARSRACAPAHRAPLRHSGELNDQGHTSSTASRRHRGDRQRGRHQARRDEPPLLARAPRLHHSTPCRLRLDRRGRPRTELPRPRYRRPRERVHPAQHHLHGVEPHAHGAACCRTPAASRHGATSAPRGTPGCASTTPTPSTASSATRNGSRVGVYSARWRTRSTSTTTKPPPRGTRSSSIGSASTATSSSAR